MVSTQYKRERKVLKLQKLMKGGEIGDRAPFIRKAPEAKSNEGTGEV